MKLTSVELLRLKMPLVRAFRTSFGVQTERDVLILVARTDGGVTGYGECVALADPVYNEEFVDSAELVLTRYLIPAVLADPDISPAKVAMLTASFVGNRMAKAALELAVLDAELRTSGMSMASYMGGVRDHVEVGVSVGITDTVEELVEIVGAHRAEGYGRVKLKIQPGFDLAPVAAVREAFGEALPLQVDANTAYGAGDVAHLIQFDSFNLLMIEQPFGEEAIDLHSQLASRCATPICLDESLTSARSMAHAIRVRACSVANIKAARLGGYLEARRAHDVAMALDTPVWCGGMLETGLGRAANLALASLPGFTLPGDISASNRYYRDDITEPFELVDGRIAVPQGPGLGVEVREDVLSRVTTSQHEVTA